jgi:hypothetical protein
MNEAHTAFVNFLIQAWCWISGLSEQTHGILMGSTFALVGVWLTNRGNLRNLRQQLAHDRAQKKTEYELSIRRDVYLGVAQSVSEGITAISRLTDLSISNAEAVAKYRDNSAQIAKIHIVAREQTAITFLEFMRGFSQAILRVSIARKPVQAIKDQMAMHLERMLRHNGSRDQALELIKQMSLNGIRDDEKFKRLSDAFEYEQSQASKAAIEHDALLDQLKPAHLKLFQSSLDEQRKLFQLLMPALKNIREELGMPIQTDSYAKALARADGFDEATLRELFGLPAECLEQRQDPNAG